MYVFVSCLPWHGEAGDWEQAARIAEEAGAEVVLGDWASEEEHRRFALGHMGPRVCQAQSQTPCAVVQSVLRQQGREALEVSHDQCESDHRAP